MGAGQSDLYSGTYGDTAENIPDALKDRIKMPRNDSQLKHIFREEEGHLPDTPENRKLISDGGRNLTNKEWDYDTGLKYNPLRRKKNE